LAAEKKASGINSSTATTQNMGRLYKSLSRIQLSTGLCPNVPLENDFASVRRLISFWFSFASSSAGTLGFTLFGVGFFGEFLSFCFLVSCLYQALALASRCVLFLSLFFFSAQAT
jgi:hypothetical protein